MTNKLLLVMVFCVSLMVSAYAQKQSGRETLLVSPENHQVASAQTFLFKTTLSKTELMTATKSKAFCTCTCGWTCDNKCLNTCHGCPG